MTDSAVIVFTEARLREMGLVGEAAPYLLVIASLVAGAPLNCAWFDNVEQVAREVQRLAPANLFTRTAGADVDSDCDELIRIIGYMREDGAYAAVRIFDWSDAETIAGQLRVLAEQITRAPQTFGKSFNAGRKRR